MLSFGPALRRARQERGISLDDVARDTRLSKRYLLALEDESIQELPGGPYNRAYVRTYAGYLGLDPDTLVRDYALEEEAQTKAGRLAVLPDVLATMRQAAERPRSQPAPVRGGLATVARVGGFAGVAVTLLVGLTWVATHRFTRSDETVPIRASEPPARGVSGSAQVAVDRAQVAVDRKEASATPPRLGPAGTADLGEGRLSPLDVEAPAENVAGAPRLLVTRSGVGTDVVDQQLVGRSDTFAVGTRVAFWTQVTGGRPGDTVRHVWSHHGKAAGAVDLPVRGSSWRTQSRRLLAAGAEGDWVVEARDPEGRVLARHEFRCAP
jgi:cytoskeletal protein RodZ